MKFFDKIFQTMTLANKTNLSLARCNGTFQREPEKSKTKKTEAKRGAVVAGAAMTADPVLRVAVSAVSGVRTNTLGEFTVMRRKDMAEDSAKATEHRKRHHVTQLEEKKRLAAHRALKSDAANSAALVTTEAELDAKLAATINKRREDRVAAATGCCPARSWAWLRLPPVGGGDGISIDEAEEQSDSDDS
mmetsp:Transcript_24699/g.41922  ORF Transcript_24699/g.41922 Transcript_24699/m.41922 type:complete len:190 (+) Transcript_24699:1-570(+)